MPLNWPLGDGPRFRGVFNRETNEVNLFERTPHGSFKAPLSVGGIEDEVMKNALDSEIYERVKQEIELLDGVTEELDLAKTLAGKQMPVFFGSAMNNFGVQLMLDRFLALAPGPAPRLSAKGPIDPHRDGFSGFVFKIQANMNPRHRDRAVFIRVVSGVFERDMQVTDIKSGRKVRLATRRSCSDRTARPSTPPTPATSSRSWGTTSSSSATPSRASRASSTTKCRAFRPECFCYLFNNDTANIKRYRAGIEQLLKEGVAQAYDVHGSAQRVPLLGAVGPLQFEVMKARLEGEYNVDCRLESSPWSVAQWCAPRIPPPTRTCATRRPSPCPRAARWPATRTNSGSSCSPRPTSSASSTSATAPTSSPRVPSTGNDAMIATGWIAWTEIAAALVAVAALTAIFLRRRRRILARNARLARPFTAAEEEVLDRDFPRWRCIPAAFAGAVRRPHPRPHGREEFRALRRSDAVTDEMKLVIAAQAAFIILGKDDHGFFPAPSLNPRLSHRLPRPRTAALRHRRREARGPLRGIVGDGIGDPVVGQRGRGRPQ